MYYYCRDTSNRTLSTGYHKHEEKKSQQEKKYKLLNISFRKPTSKCNVFKLLLSTVIFLIYFYYIFYYYIIYYYII